MPTSPPLLRTVLAIGCLWSALPARADEAPPEDAPLQREVPPDMRKVKAARHSAWMAYVGVRAPTAHGGRPRHVAAPADPVEGPRTLLIRLGVEGGLQQQGGALGFQFGLDGQRWGMAERLELVSAVATNGSGGLERLQLISAHVTFSPLVGPRGRLRLEGGAAVAHASGVTFFGPSVGLSFERCLFGGLDLEGRGQWVPMPHVQREGQLGLALHLGGLTLRGGWRVLSFDDRAQVDGEVHTVRGGGPFAGVGLNF